MNASTIRPEINPSLPLTDKILMVIEASPNLSLDVAVAQVGLSNILTIFDVARIKRIFVEAGQGSRNGFGCIGDLERPYFWTSEYFGPAPIGHPAEGSLILAPVEQVGDTKVPAAGVMAKLFGGSGSVRISLTRYGVCEVKSRCDTYFIKNFQEGPNGLMVPILDEEKGDATWAKEVNPLGSIMINGTGSENINAVSFRPVSWSHDLCFTNVDAPSPFAYKVVRKDWLVGMI